MGCSPDNDDHRSGGVTPTVFTDTPLVADDQPVKIQHINELRTAINNETVVRNGTGATYTDTPLNADDVPIKDVHINELNAQSAVMHAAPRCIKDTTPAPSLSDVSVGDPLVKAHINALRSYVNLKENVECFCDCDYICVDKTDKTDKTDKSDKSDCGDNNNDM